MKKIIASAVMLTSVMGVSVLAEDLANSNHVELNPVKHFTFVDEERRNEEGDDVVRSIEFSMVNDNPFLNLIPAFETEDDFGYTHGVSLAYSYLNRKNNRMWEVDFDTALYTEQVTPEGEDAEEYYDDTFPNVPQRFNEVSHLRVQTSDIYDTIGKDKKYLVVGVGVGLMNDRDETGVLAVGQQTAWHDYKHNNLTPEQTPMYANVPGNTNKVFGSAKVAVGKVVTFNEDMQKCGCEINRLKIEYGAEVYSIQEGSNVYFLIAYNQKVAEVANVNFYVDLENKVTYHGDWENETFLGVSARYKNFTVSTGMSYRQGNQNNDFFKFQDDDAIWTLRIKYQF